MHKKALAHFGMQGDYELFDIAPEHLAARLGELHKSGVTGFNVTIPHKVVVFSLCRQLTPEALNVSAVHCQVRR